MDQLVKKQIEELLKESREAALEFLLGWVIGLNANGNFLTEDDVAFIFDTLNDDVPQIGVRKPYAGIQQ